MSADEERSIVPYLNPKYWHDHTLGYGAAVAPPQLPVHMDDDRFARRVVRERVRTGGMTPLHTYRTDETFDPAQYQPGTVILYRLELLRGPVVQGDYSIEALERQPVPPMETALTPAFGPHVPNCQIDEDESDRSYFAQIRMGVVPHRNDEGYVLARLTSGFVPLHGNRVRVYGPFFRQAAPLTVGRTMHWVVERRERLERVAALQVVAYGAATRRRMPEILRGFLPAFGANG